MAAMPEATVSNLFRTNLHKSFRNFSAKMHLSALVQVRAKTHHLGSISRRPAILVRNLSDRHLFHILIKYFGFNFNFDLTFLISSLMPNDRRQFNSSSAFSASSLLGGFRAIYNFFHKGNSFPGYGMRDDNRRFLIIACASSTASFSARKSWPVVSMTCQLKDSHLLLSGSSGITSRCLLQSEYCSGQSRQ